jgi:hypothetical protein
MDCHNESAERVPLALPVLLKSMPVDNFTLAEPVAHVELRYPSFFNRLLMSDDRR